MNETIHKDQKMEMMGAYDEEDARRIYKECWILQIYRIIGQHEDLILPAGKRLICFFFSNHSRRRLLLSLISKYSHEFVMS